MAVIKSLKNVIELNVDGEDKVLRFDFSDVRFKNKILKLMKKWRDLGKEIEAKEEEIAGIKDNLDRLLEQSNYEVELYESFKDDINAAFDCDITGIMFGNIVPSITRYSELFSRIAPYVEEASNKELSSIEALNKKYGLGIAADSSVIERVDI